MAIRLVRQALNAADDGRITSRSNQPVEPSCRHLFGQPHIRFPLGSPDHEAIRTNQQRAQSQSILGLRDYIFHTPCTSREGDLSRPGRCLRQAGQHYREDARGQDGQVLRGDLPARPAVHQEQSQTIAQIIATRVAKLGENISVRRFARFKVGDPNWTVATTAQSSTDEATA